MSSVLKLCAVLAVFAIAVLANPIAPQDDETTVSSTAEENADSKIEESLTEEQPAAGEFETPEENQPASEITNAPVAPLSVPPPSVALSSAVPASTVPSSVVPSSVVPASAVKSSAAQSSDMAHANQEISGRLLKIDLPTSTKAPKTPKQNPKPRNSESTTEAASSTTARNESSITSPNRMSIAAALMLMVIIKMCATF